MRSRGTGSEDHSINAVAYLTLKGELIMPEILRVCYDRILPQDLRRFAQLNRGDPLRAAVLKAKKWPNGSTLRVRFMGGNSTQQDIVRQFAPEWTKYANLKFNFTNVSDAEIRISFVDNDGAWSYLGTDCQNIPLNEATMNLGWQDEGVVLHEFGHAIGLIHEHQNPEGGIKWNRENVIRDLSGPPNNWPLETIEHNIFAAYAREQLNSTALDKKSIMLYAIPARWTLDGFQSEPNEVLSEVDKRYIGDPVNYPFAEAEVKELPVAETTQAEIGQAGEQDLYTFSARSAGRYTIETAGPTDMVMALYGPDNRTNLIADDDDSGSDRNAKIVANLVPGTYFVQVRHYNSAGGTGAYGIKVSRY
jgi:hypothetical protein